MSVIMSANFFPMLSASPPPIDEDDDDSVENDDDDFGMYASAHNAFDSGLDSPVSNKSLKSKDALTECDHAKSISSANTKCASVPNHLGENDSSIEANDLNVEKIHRINCVNSESSKASKSDYNFISSSETNNVRYGKYVLINRSENSCLEPIGDVENEVSLNSSHLNDSSQDFVPLVTGYDDEVKTKQSACSEENEELQSENAYFLTNDQEDLLESVKDIPETFPGDNCIQEEEEEQLCLNESENTDKSRSSCDGHVIADNTNLPSKLDGSLNCLDGHTDLNEKQKLCSSVLSSLSCRELPDLNLTSYPFDDDDFEDFQDANFALNSSASNVHNSNYPPCETKKFSEQCNDVEDDSFGDFESVGTLPQKIDDFSAKVTTPDDFADFESCVNDFAGQDPSDDKASEGNDFANFESASFNEPVEDLGKFGSADNKIVKVVNAVFPLVDELAVVTEESSPSLNSDVLDQNGKSRRLWDKLHDNDQTPGLPFQWAVSHSFQQLLRSINVDYHSILRTSTVPFFASGLGLLEPVKGMVTALDQKKTNESSLNLQQNPIPPVHFDWSSSGLVNPLDSVQAASTLMDLSFLCSSTATNSASSLSSKNKNKSKDFSLENELLKPLPETVNTDSTLKPQILEKLLSSNNSSVTEASQLSCRPPHLSQEAVHVLDQLPDISFMKAKVLMFPIAGT